MKKLNDDVFQRVYVKEAFEQIASTYDRGRRIWYEIILLLIQNMENIGGFIADIGCGTGKNTVELAKMDDTIGLDISKNMVKILRRRAYRKKISERIYPIVASMMLLPFRKNIFKAVTLLATIHNVPGKQNREKAFKELWRTCRSKCIIIVTAWKLFYPKNFLKALFYWLRYRYTFGDAFVEWRKEDKVIYRFYHFFTRGELATLIKKHGFKILKIFVWSPKKKILKDNIVVIAVKNDEKGYVSS